MSRQAGGRQGGHRCARLRGAPSGAADGAAPGVGACAPPSLPPFLPAPTQPNPRQPLPLPTAVSPLQGHQTYTEKPGHGFTLNADFDGVKADAYDALYIPGWVTCFNPWRPTAPSQRGCGCD